MLSDAGYRSICETAAESGPAVVAVTLAQPHGRSRVEVVWANPAARDLLGGSLESMPHLDPPWRTPLEDVEAPPHWTKVVSGLITNPPVDADAWHTARVDWPLVVGTRVRLRLRPAADASSYLVWLRPADDDVAVAEEAAADADYRFRALGENAPIGIVLSEVGARLGFANQAFAAISGVEISALLGTGWLSTVVAEDMPSLLESIDEVLAGETADLTLRMHSLVGPSRWVRLRLAPVMTRQRAAGFVGTAEDITARREWEAQLSHQASHDALTGLINRRRLMEVLTDLFDSTSRSRRNDRDIALLFCDLDGFKEINDQFGHDAGDRVLIEVAHRLTTAARDHDMVARLAGDEFVLLLRQISGVREAEAAAARQLAALTRPIQVGRARVEIKASLGIAMGRDHTTAASLLRAADAGMYEVKRAGGGIARPVSE